MITSQGEGKEQGMPTHHDHKPQGVRVDEEIPSQAQESRHLLQDRVGRVIAIPPDR